MVSLPHLLGSITTLGGGTEMTSSSGVSRDTDKIDGDKYKEHHENEKDLVKTCASDVKAERSNVVSSLKSKATAYDIQIQTLRNSYSFFGGT